MRQLDASRNLSSSDRLVRSTVVPTLYLFPPDIRRFPVPGRAGPVEWDSAIPQNLGVFPNIDHSACRAIFLYSQGASTNPTWHRRLMQKLWDKNTRNNPGGS